MISEVQAVSKSASIENRKSKIENRLYYDVPLLKSPVWTWEIPAYFFLGGLSAGAYLLARMAARFGGGRFKEVTRAGSAIAAGALLPCPALLVSDLGDPKRFHYMLRVFKPKSPMNLGAWTLSGYGAMATLAALNEWRKASREAALADADSSSSLPMKIMDEAIESLLDGAGLPLALLLAGYTGVLLSTTSTPLWTRNTWLGPLFSASAVSAGAAAINLALEARSPVSPISDNRKSKIENRKWTRPLEQAASAAKLAEAVTLAGFLTTAGKLAEPVTKGRYAPHLWGGAVGAGLLLSTLLEHAPVKSKQTRRALRIAGAVAGLAGGFALRWAITRGGIPSGSDPNAAREASR